MPKLEFTSDPDTGELTFHIKGIVGPACDDVARLAKELLSQPAREEETAEYRLRPPVRPTIRPQGGDRT